jgi:tetraprenyl-beta-curcumene synthase
MACLEHDAAAKAARGGRCSKELRRIGLLQRFLAVAMRYWTGVFPVIRSELRQWRARAGAIPDPALRRLAFEAHGGKRGNLEGAAAFAVFVPQQFGLPVTRALVAFQGAYDYVDVLSEQPSEDTIASGYRLHLTLVAALEPGGRRLNGYAHHPVDDDAGYLQAFTDACRSAVDRLPSYPATVVYATEGARRIAFYQGLNNWGDGGGPEEYARWAAEETPSGTGLRWWETGAAAGSSLSVFAALAAAADALVGPGQALAIDTAYFPWIGALHTLLDSLVDHPADVRQGQHSLVEHYADAQEMAGRMHEIAQVSMHRAGALPHGRSHQMLLAAMSCFYLVAPEASLAYAVLARARIIEAIGDLAGPTMAIMRARQSLDSHGGSTAQL